MPLLLGWGILLAFSWLRPRVRSCGPFALPRWLVRVKSFFMPSVNWPSQISMAVMVEAQALPIWSAAAWWTLYGRLALMGCPFADPACAAACSRHRVQLTMRPVAGLTLSWCCVSCSWCQAVLGTCMSRTRCGFHGTQDEMLMFRNYARKEHEAMARSMQLPRLAAVHVMPKAASLRSVPPMKLSQGDVAISSGPQLKSPARRHGTL